MPTAMTTAPSLSGLTRKFIGATFEGETRDAEGGVFAECELEGDGITPEVRFRYEQSHFEASLINTLPVLACLDAARKGRVSIRAI